jgi:hypothetical protein
MFTCEMTYVVVLLETLVNDSTPDTRPARSNALFQPTPLVQLQSRSSKVSVSSMIFEADFSEVTKKFAMILVNEYRTIDSLSQSVPGMPSPAHRIGAPVNVSFSYKEEVPLSGWSKYARAAGRPKNNN